MPVTPPALTEDLIRDSDSLFVDLLRNALIGVYIIQDGLFRYANPRFAEMFGYTQEEICGQIGPSDLTSPSDDGKVAAAVAERLAGRSDTAHYSFHGRRKDGSELELEVFGKRTAFEGRPAIIGMLVDITARHAAERQAIEQLNFIGQLVEAIPSPLFFKDEQARYLGCNRAFEAFMGLDREDIVGRSVFDISPPELAARYHSADQALFDAPGVQTYEASVASGDGLTREVLFNKATWLKSDGQVGGLVGVITDITERKQTEALIWVQANYDALTGLPNRRLLNDRLTELMKKAHRDHESVAVLFIDLDRFKEVNDVLGHDAGDRLLVEAARRIVGCLRETDTVARQGGDEFTVLLPCQSDEAPIERIADDIITALDRPFTLGNDVAYVSASIGITLYPRDGDTLASILKNADQAMYHAKDAGRNRFSYYSPSMQEHAQARLQMGTDLRTALAEGQLSLHYQPILNLANGEVFKAEALLRWQHPALGEIPPTEFIPVAEELGLIDAIGSWVFDSAIAAVARWRTLWPEDDRANCPLQISVNASPRQFTGGRSIDGLLARLEALGLPGHCMAIEITEGMLLDKHPAVAAQLSRLAAAGVPVTIDDFGTGYSAMAYLKRLDIDTLKIDRSFIRDLTTDPGDLAIAEAIIAMAHKLGIRVVAEGVETLEQQSRLNDAGCDYSQGFLFSRPLPEAAFFELIARYRP
ncbi:putative bifunctional diguanylate cyclase/phosphodiesterase [Zoogloea dura]|uniref:EAL domain-containing protein n=1 Tax=Zoogloea dura TaxID=2728840 RepID=A0A848GCH9_9RHOO|nr:EAL domain-containing protein [Zoogloea dura]NML27191.1 EAL domain-containing protein [Zoogloea dura]